MESEERSEEAQEREEAAREHQERAASDTPQHDVGPTGQPAEGAEAEPESQD